MSMCDTDSSFFFAPPAGGCTQPDRAGPRTDDDLLADIRAGDRAAAAEFIRRHEALIRRRVRHKLGAALRRTVDSEDLVSTLSRRLDVYMTSAALMARSPEQMMALILKIASRSIHDKLRIQQRLQRAEAEDGPIALAVRERLEHPPSHSAEFSFTVEEMLALIPAETDREIARMWLHGDSHQTIATELGITTQAVRKRWERIKGSLRQRIEAA